MVHGRDYILVILGDDVIIIFVKEALDKHGSIDLRQSFADYVWENFRIKANHMKQRVSDISGYFCKRRYARQGKRVKDPQTNRDRIASVYSLMLAANSLLYPESLNGNNAPQHLVRIWQVCDNVYSHPLYKAFRQGVYNLYRSKTCEVIVTDNDVAEFNAGHRQWRVRLYGERFDASTSPTAQWWISQQ